MMLTRLLVFVVVGLFFGGCAHSPSRAVTAKASPMAEGAEEAAVRAAPVSTAKSKSSARVRAFRTETRKAANAEARALMHGELVLRHYHPRSGWTMYAFPGVTHLADEPETSPLMLYAAYRQYQIALRALRGAIARIDALAPRRASQRSAKLKQRLVHALVVLRHDRAAAPEGVRRYWAYLAEVGRKLPGLY